MSAGPYAPTPSPRRRLRAAALSDIGRERDHNEDVVLCLPERGVFAVIDGVGGAVAGETGARTAADILGRRLARRDAASLEQEIREAIALANNRIFDLARKDPRLHGMSCVLTVAVVDGDRVTVGHVGDTRLYRLGPEGMELVTRDHSPVGDLERRGELSEREAMLHPRRNEIYRDVGTLFHRPDDEQFVEVFVTPFGADEALVLCSDGLTDLVPAATVRETVMRCAGDPEAAARQLVELANRAGGKDNISVLVVEGEAFGRSATARQPSEDTHRLRVLGTPGGPEEAEEADGPRAAPMRHGPRAPMAGAASGRRRGLAGVGRRAAALIAVAAVVAGGLWLASREPVRATLRSWWPAFDGVVHVGPERAVRSITAGLERARRGQRVEVDPGIYEERIELREGVSVSSRVPRQAILRPPREGTLDATAVVVAAGLASARLEGFVIDGGGALDVGVSLLGSRIEVENVEVLGTLVAALDIGGADRSTLRFNHLHDNAGHAVRVRSPAAPRLLGNLLRGTEGAAAETITVEPGAAPLLVDNRFRGRRTGVARVPSPTAAAELLEWNDLGEAETEDAVVISRAGSGEGQ